MIDVTNENVIRLAEACRVFRPSKPLHVATLHRWTTNGLHGLKLESVRIGWIRYTSHEAIGRFIAALNGYDVPDAAQAPSGSAQTAAQRLKELGC